MALWLLGGWAPNLQAQNGQAPQSIHAQALPDAPGYVSQEASGHRPAGAAAPSTIEGTVVSTNGDVVEGARVVLSEPGGAHSRTTESGSNGQFAFEGLPAETFKLTVSGPGMGTVVSEGITVEAGETRFLPKVILPFNAGVTEVRVTANREEIAEEEVHLEESQRVLGIVPNFYSSYDWNAPPLSAKQKFQLAFRSEMDPMTFAGAAAVAGAEEYRGIYPGYGTGFSGFGKRFAAQYANDFDSKMIGSAVLPSLLHQDPRYFYKGTGTVRSRALYAIRSAFICRGDNGREEFDYSHILGDFSTGAMSNIYYPEANEGAGLILTNGLIEIGGAAGTNLIREFLLRGLTTHARGNR
ncbi:MAG TPA: carboxypeptidase-like regulatory domain-containing protein [Acidobacteriaceae bacterium]|nr:carboxypeptidase-like regulatory domain-containing protein [Acidobacteriaceae bacterium]